MTESFLDSNDAKMASKQGRQRVSTTGQAPAKQAAPPSDPHVEYERLCSWICHEPELSAKALQSVNATLNGFPRQVQSVRQSLGLLSQAKVQQLAKQPQSAQTSLGEASVPFLRQKKLAVRTAIFAEVLAELLQHDNVSEVFTAGLLHNAVELNPDMPCERYPETLQSVMAYYRSPELADKAHDTVMLVAIARRCAEDRNISPAMFSWLQPQLGVSEHAFYAWRERFMHMAEERYEIHTRWAQGYQAS